MKCARVRFDAKSDSEYSIHFSDQALSSVILPLSPSEQTTLYERIINRLLTLSTEDFPVNFYIARIICSNNKDWSILYTDYVSITIIKLPPAEIAVPFIIKWREQPDILTSNYANLSSCLDVYIRKIHAELHITIPEFLYQEITQTHYHSLITTAKELENLNEDKEFSAHTKIILNNLAHLNIAKEDNGKTFVKKFLSKAEYFQQTIDNLTAVRLRSTQECITKQEVRAGKIIAWEKEIFQHKNKLFYLIFIVASKYRWHLLQETSRNDQLRQQELTKFNKVFAGFIAVNLQTFEWHDLKDHYESYMTFTLEALNEETNSLLQRCNTSLFIFKSSDKQLFFKHTYNELKDQLQDAFVAKFKKINTNEIDRINWCERVYQTRNEQSRLFVGWKTAQRIMKRELGALHANQIEQLTAITQSLSEWRDAYLIWAKVDKEKNRIKDSYHRLQQEALQLQQNYSDQIAICMMYYDEIIAKDTKLNNQWIKNQKSFANTWMLHEKILTQVSEFLIRKPDNYSSLHALQALEARSQLYNARLKTMAAWFDSFKNTLTQRKLHNHIEEIQIKAQQVVNYYRGCDLNIGPNQVQLKNSQVVRDYQANVRNIILLCDKYLSQENNSALTIESVESDAQQLNQWLEHEELHLQNMHRLRMRNPPPMQLFNVPTLGVAPKIIPLPKQNFDLQMLENYILYYLAIERTRLIQQNSNGVLGAKLNNLRINKITETEKNIRIIVACTEKEMNSCQIYSKRLDILHHSKENINSVIKSNLLTKSLTSDRIPGSYYTKILLNIIMFITIVPPFLKMFCSNSECPFFPLTTDYELNVRKMVANAP